MGSAIAEPFFCLCGMFHVEQWPSAALDRIVRKAHGKPPSLTMGQGSPSPPIRQRTYLSSAFLPAHLIRMPLLHTAKRPFIRTLRLARRPSRELHRGQGTLPELGAFSQTGSPRRSSAPNRE